MCFLGIVGMQSMAFKMKIFLEKNINKKSYFSKIKELLFFDKGK